MYAFSTEVGHEQMVVWTFQLPAHIGLTMLSTVAQYAPVKLLHSHERLQHFTDM